MTTKPATHKTPKSPKSTPSSTSVNPASNTPKPTPANPTSAAPKTAASKPTPEPISPIKKDHIILTFTLVLGIAVIITLLFILPKPSATSKPSQETRPSIPSEPDPKPEPNPEPTTPAFINLQPTVDAWVKTTSAKVGLSIFDLDNNRLAASYHADERFSIASLYKLFYVYPLYEEILAGNENPDAHLVTTTDYRADSYTLSDCLDLVIRESYNGCANALRSNKSYNILVSNFLTNLKLSHTSNSALYSTADDLTTLLIHYYAHPTLDDATWAKIADSLLNQPITSVDEEDPYNWRMGLPSGFSDAAIVYNKVGWEYADNTWKIYNDAAIVEFPTLNRHYIMVVLTSGLTGEIPLPLRHLAKNLEKAILEHSSQP